ncbi:chloride channel protein [Ginsengibacter hankyongi]|uniref:Chloride channel protein n=1 Tax=Ginsengibacter hankyongi TaxID=2607284 RepID=A0A5J5ILT0_9BACT|nr:chloride channel protein [Ginsengibacter hankyongi]KAA9040472.1 chloride channel protein [Ginsengibacter hankyongi]
MYEKILRYIERINQWRKLRISNSNFLIIVAAVVGIMGGITSSVLKELTHSVANFLQNDLHWEYKYYLYFFFPLIGIFLTVAYIRTFIRRSKFQHGIAPILFNISHNSSKLEFHNIYSQVISSALTVGLGGSAGLEAPAVYSGAAIGSNMGRFFGLNYRETSLLLACGAAAGISGAFNSPVAGMIFAIEVIMPEFSIPAVIPLLIASAFSSVVSQLIYKEPLFVLVTRDWVLHAFWYYIVLGILVGIYSVYFSRLTKFVSGTFRKIKNKYNRIWIGGITLGVMIALLPTLYGEGYITIQKLLDGNYQSILANSFFSKYQLIPWVLLLFAALSLVGKTFASTITMASGGNGGMFGPSVVVGGLLGFVFAFGLNQTGTVQLNVTNFIIAGMAASLSGVMHAPLTGVFLAAEITGGYAMMVPLMVVSAISYFINKGILKYSIYTAELAEQGNLVSKENKDHNILRRIKLKYLIEKDFVILRPDDTPRRRSYDIVHTVRNIFPVVTEEGELTGVIYSDQLLELLVSNKIEDQNRLIKEIAHPPDKVINVNTSMSEVMQIMDSLDTRILPVIGPNNKYLGFVTKNGIFNKYRHMLKRQGNEF